MKKQEYERMQFYQRLEESKKKLVFVEANLEKVLENEKNHKLINSDKVGFSLSFYVFNIGSRQLV